MKKIIINGLFIGVIIVLAATFIPDAGERVASWFFPPRIYILIGVGILLVLWKILIELQNNKRDGGE